MTKKRQQTLSSKSLKSRQSNSILTIYGCEKKQLKTITEFTLNKFGFFLTNMTKARKYRHGTVEKPGL